MSSTVGTRPTSAESVAFFDSISHTASEVVSPARRATSDARKTVILLPLRGVSASSNSHICEGVSLTSHRLCERFRKPEQAVASLVEYSLEAPQLTRAGRRLSGADTPSAMSEDPRLWIR